MNRRRRRRLMQTLTWPVALLIVGWAMGWIAFLLAASQGLTFRLYGVVQGVGDLVILIGAIWLAAALVRLGLSSWKERRAPGPQA